MSWRASPLPLARATLTSRNLMERGARSNVSLMKFVYTPADCDPCLLVACVVCARARAFPGGCVLRPALAGITPNSAK